MISKQLGIRLSRAKRRVMAHFLRGNNFKCNFCDRTFRRFMPGGQKKYGFKDKYYVVGLSYCENNFCPHCHSRNRIRNVLQFLKEKKILPVKRMLHVSPDPLLRKQIETYVKEYTASDLNQNFASLQLDLTNLKSIDSNYYDAIICNHVLEHIPDDIKALSEIYRVLKPGGWAILPVPFCIDCDDTMEVVYADIDRKGKIKNKWYPQSLFLEALHGFPDHVRTYGFLDYDRRLKGAGFILDKHPARLKYDNHSLGVEPDDMIWFVKKPKK